MVLLKRNKMMFNTHLILSIVCLIPLIIVAVTGSILSYQNEIADFINKGAMRVETIGDKKLEPSEILTKFAELTGKKPLNLEIAEYEGEAFKIYTSKKEAYFVNPYTGDVVGMDESGEFMDIVLMLHRNLGFSFLQGEEDIIKDIGKHIVAATTIILFLLVISGIWLYYPMMKNGFLKSLGINFRAKGYGFFYKLHSAAGIWASVFLIIMC